MSMDFGPDLGPDLGPDIGSGSHMSGSGSSSGTTTITILDFVNTFGTYAYGTNLETLEVSTAGRLRISKSAGKDGGFTGGGLLDVRKIVAKGIFTPSGSDLLRADWDTFLAAHAPGVPQALKIDSDRYINAEVEALTTGDWNGLSYYPYQLSFVCADPFWYAVSSQSESLTYAGTANTIPTAGTAYCLPVITLVVTAAGTISISNGAGNNITVAPTTPGTYVLDSTSESVTSAGTDFSSIIQSGQFLTLAGGSDTLTITLSGGATVSAASVSWQSRWY